MSSATLLCRSSHRAATNTNGMASRTDRHVDPEDPRPVDARARSRRRRSAPGRRRSLSPALNMADRRCRACSGGKCGSQECERKRQDERGAGTPARRAPGDQEADVGAQAHTLRMAAENRREPRTRTSAFRPEPISERCRGSSAARRSSGCTRLDGPLEAAATDACQVDTKGAQRRPRRRLCSSAAIIDAISGEGRRPRFVFPAGDVRVRLHVSPSRGFVAMEIRRAAAIHRGGRRSARRKSGKPVRPRGLCRRNAVISAMRPISCRA